MPFHPSKQQPDKFSALSVLSVDKKWVADGQSAPSSDLGWLAGFLFHITVKHTLVGVSSV